jgi:hypothetical protein
MMLRRAGLSRINSKAGYDAGRVDAWCVRSNNLSDRTGRAQAPMHVEIAERFSEATFLRTTFA